MMQYSEGVSEILTSPFKWNFLHRRMDEARTGEVREIFLGDRERFVACVDAMKNADTGKNQFRPTARPAAHVKPLGVRRQRRPRKDVKISFKKFEMFGLTEVGLVVARPLVAKA